MVYQKQIRLKYSVIFSTFIGLILFFSCKNDLTNTQKTKENVRVNEEVAHYIEVEYSEIAKKKAILRAPKMIKRMDSSDISYFPDGLVLEMYGEMGELSSTLYAKKGQMDHVTQQMKAKDSVRVISTNGQKLFGDELIWSQTQRILTTTGSVQVQTPTEVIFGDTLTADENLRIYRIRKVKGIIQVKK